MPSRKCWTGVASVLISACMAGGAVLSAAEGAPEALGLMAVRGVVWVDRLPAPSSTAVYGGDTVTTDKGSEALVRLRSGMTVALEEQGEVELPRQGAATDLKLRQGVLTVSNSGRETTARVKVLGASVEVRGRAGLPGVCRIAAYGNRAEVIADQGEVEILGRGMPVRLGGGKVARLEAGGRSVPSTAEGGPGAPQEVRKAGTVSGAIPAETVQRQGQGAEVPLAVSDPVNWQDVVQTQNTGRVRISLLDGSVLNVGARSVMRIVEHNPQTQQTQVELTLGRVRGQVVKLTKPGSNFQLKTQTAVIGVVGTIFVVEADANSTHVMCVEGKVAVQNINPAIQGQVQLGPGQSTVVAAGAAPTAAATTTASEVQSALERTEIRPGAAAATTGPQTPTGLGAQAGTTAAKGATAGTGIGGTTITVGTAAAAAAGGASAVAGVTALSKANDAVNGLNQANSALQTATSTTNAATTAINQSKQPTLSPSTPCGCGS